MRTANLAIVFTEIVGYADRLSRLTYEQSQRMLRLHEALVIPVFRAFHGRRVKTMGGTLLVAFESPTQAVLCGAAVQDRIWEWNQSVPEWDRVEVRAGANVGEVRLDKGDVFGEPVNIASRVLGLAGPGEVVFAESIWLSMNRNEVDADDGGLVTLKGVPEPIRIYRVRPAADPTVKPYGGHALARAGRLRIPDPNRLTGAEIRGHLRAAADSAWSHISEAFPWLATQARVAVLGAAGAMLLVLVLLLAPNAVERALARQDLTAAQREVQSMRAGPKRTYYEGRILEARREWDGAARDYESAVRGGERGAFDHLLNLARGGSCEARVAAARALGRLGDQDAIAVLRKMADDSRTSSEDGLLTQVLGCESRTAARDALEQIRGAE
ncbi:MAG: adenylate/guanylate cyclase domain-containing protein [Myxococcales bacterium]